MPKQQVFNLREDIIKTFTGDSIHNMSARSKRPNQKPSFVVIREPVRQEPVRSLGPRRAFVHGAASVDLEHDTLLNSDYRRVYFTASHMQIVLMCLEPGSAIEWESHNSDQFFRVESGSTAIETYEPAVRSVSAVQVHTGQGAVVAAGTVHRVLNPSPDHQCQLYTIYSPPQHSIGLVQATKADADAAQEEHKD